MAKSEIPLSPLPQSERVEITKLHETTAKIFELSQMAAWEFAKFLFAANTGAAAGMLVMVHESHGNNSWLIWSFIVFCFGVFFVGLAYFVAAVGLGMSAQAWMDDLQKVDKFELSLPDLMQNRRKWVRGWKSKIVPVCGVLSFVCLITGGVMAIIPLSSNEFYSNQSKTIALQIQQIAPKK